MGGVDWTQFPEGWTDADRLAASRGAAVVFVRRKATWGIGHVGWGFLLESGETRRTEDTLVGDGNIWEIGAVENHHGTIFTSPLDDGYWRQKTADPLATVASRGYDHYKVIPVPEPNNEKALAEERRISERPYIAAVCNCMNDVYEILKAYGVPGLPDPQFILNWLPNAWYDHIEATQFAIDDPTGLSQAPRLRIGRPIAAVR